MSISMFLGQELGKSINKCCGLHDLEGEDHGVAPQPRARAMIYMSVKVTRVTKGHASDQKVTKCHASDSRSLSVKVTR